MFPYALLILTGLLAVGVGWNDGRLRGLVQASLFVPVLALVVAMVFGPVLEGAGLGTAVRLGAGLAGSLLAMLALMRFGPTHRS